jgi:hypothetical protein
LPGRQPGEGVAVKWTVIWPGLVGLTCEREGRHVQDEPARGYRIWILHGFSRDTAQAGDCTVDALVGAVRPFPSRVEANKPEVGQQSRVGIRLHPQENLFAVEVVEKQPFAKENEKDRENRAEVAGMFDDAAKEIGR